VKARGFRPVLVKAASVISAAGDCVEQTCTSIRAGICAFKQHEARVSASADETRPVTAAPVAAIDPAIVGAARLIQLLAPVLRDVVARAELARRDLGDTALLLALPAPEAAMSAWGLGDEFLDELRKHTGLRFASAAAFAAGHAGMISLLAEASALLATERVRSCVVAGVDSYLSPDRLAALDASYRLKSARNVDGLVPGEAAAALVVEAADRRRPRGAPLGVVSAVGLGEEPETVCSEKASTGRGLCEALRAVVPASCPWVICDLNGESYRAFEWGVARTRMGEVFSALRRVVVPAASLGDVGAATGGVLLASALAALQRGYAPAEEAIVWSASDGPLRAAARVGGLTP
jgi:3-oxoacyl-[acyl-carrier-protein] synthase-1